MSKAKRFAHHGGYSISTDNLGCKLCDWPHHVNNIDNLKTALLAGFNRLLTGYH